MTSTTLRRLLALGLLVLAAGCDPTVEATHPLDPDTPVHEQRGEPLRVELRMADGLPIPADKVMVLMTPTGGGDPIARCGAVVDDRVVAEFAYMPDTRQTADGPLEPWPPGTYALSVRDLSFSGECSGTDPLVGDPWPVDAWQPQRLAGVADAPMEEAAATGPGLAEIELDVSGRQWVVRGTLARRIAQRPVRLSVDQDVELDGAQAVARVKGGTWQAGDGALSRPLVGSPGAGELVLSGVPVGVGVGLRLYVPGYDRFETTLDVQPDGTPDRQDPIELRSLTAEVEITGIEEQGGATRQTCLEVHLDGLDIDAEPGQLAAALEVAELSGRAIEVASSKPDGTMGACLVGERVDLARPVPLPDESKRRTVCVCLLRLLGDSGGEGDASPLLDGRYRVMARFFADGRSIHDAQAGFELDRASVARHGLIVLDPTRGEGPLRLIEPDDAVEPLHLRGGAALRLWADESDVAFERAWAHPEADSTELAMSDGPLRQLAESIEFGWCADPDACADWERLSTLIATVSDRAGNPAEAEYSACLDTRPPSLGGLALVHRDGGEPGARLSGRDGEYRLFRSTALDLVVGAASAEGFARESGCAVDAPFADAHRLSVSYEIGGRTHDGPVFTFDGPIAPGPLSSSLGLPASDGQRVMLRLEATDRAGNTTVERWPVQVDLAVPEPPRLTATQRLPGGGVQTISAPTPLSTNGSGEADGNGEADGSGEADGCGGADDCVSVTLSPAGEVRDWISAECRLQRFDADGVLTFERLEACDPDDDCGACPIDLEPLLALDATTAQAVVTARVTDAAGHISGWSEPLPVIIDRAPPSLELSLLPEPPDWAPCDESDDCLVRRFGAADEVELQLAASDDRAADGLWVMWGETGPVSIDDPCTLPSGWQIVGPGRADFGESTIDMRHPLTDDKDHPLNDDNSMLSVRVCDRAGNAFDASRILRRSEPPALQARVESTGQIAVHGGVWWFGPEPDAWLALQVGPPPASACLGSPNRNRVDLPPDNGAPVDLQPEPATVDAVRVTVSGERASALLPDGSGVACHPLDADNDEARTRWSLSAQAQDAAGQTSARVDVRVAYDDRPPTVELAISEGQPLDPDGAACEAPCVGVSSAPRVTLHAFDAGSGVDRALIDREPCPADAPAVGEADPLAWLRDGGSTRLELGPGDHRLVACAWDRLGQRAEAAMTVRIDDRRPQLRVVDVEVVEITGDEVERRPAAFDGQTHHVPSQSAGRWIEATVEVGEPLGAASPPGESNPLARYMLWLQIEGAAPDQTFVLEAGPLDGEGPADSVRHTFPLDDLTAGACGGAHGCRLTFTARDTVGNQVVETARVRVDDTPPRLLGWAIQDRVVEREQGWIVDDDALHGGVVEADEALYLSASRVPLWVRVGDEGGPWTALSYLFARDGCPRSPSAAEALPVDLGASATGVFQTYVDVPATGGEPSPVWLCVYATDAAGNALDVPYGARLHVDEDDPAVQVRIQPLVGAADEPPAELNQRAGRCRLGRSLNAVIQVYVDSADELPLGSALCGTGGVSDCIGSDTQGCRTDADEDWDALMADLESITIQRDGASVVECVREARDEACRVFAHPMGLTGTRALSVRLVDVLGVPADEDDGADEGEHDSTELITVRVVDRAGNTREVQRMVHIDLTPPEFRVTEIAGRPLAPYMSPPPPEDSAEDDAEDDADDADDAEDDADDDGCDAREVPCGTDDPACTVEVCAGYHPDHPLIIGTSNPTIDFAPRVALDDLHIALSATTNEACAAENISDLDYARALDLDDTHPLGGTGAQTLCAAARDGAGNLSDEPQTIYLYVDTRAPSFDLAVRAQCEGGGCPQAEASCDCGSRPVSPTFGTRILRGEQAVLWLDIRDGEPPDAPDAPDEAGGELDAGVDGGLDGGLDGAVDAADAADAASEEPRCRPYAREDGDGDGDGRYTITASDGQTTRVWHTDEHAVKVPPLDPEAERSEFEITVTDRQGNVSDPHIVRLVQDHEAPVLHHVQFTAFEETPCGDGEVCDAPQALTAARSQPVLVDYTDDPVGPAPTPPALHLALVPGGDCPSACALTGQTPSSVLASTLPMTRGDDSTLCAVLVDRAGHVSEVYRRALHIRPSPAVTFDVQPGAGSVIARQAGERVEVRCARSGCDLDALGVEVGGALTYPDGTGDDDTPHLTDCRLLHWAPDGELTRLRCPDPGRDLAVGEWRGELSDDPHRFELSDGTHLFELELTDDLDQAAIARFEVRVDARAPAITTARVNMPFRGKEVAGCQPVPTTNPGITVRGEAGASYAVVERPGGVCGDPDDAGWLDSPPRFVDLADARGEDQARCIFARDAAGNVSQPVQVCAIYDPDPPHVEVTLDDVSIPRGGDIVLSSADDPVRGRQPTLTIRASGRAGEQYHLLVDGDPNPVDFAGDSLAFAPLKGADCDPRFWPCPLDREPPAPTLEAWPVLRVYDMAGNEARFPVHFWWDGEPPPKPDTVRIIEGGVQSVNGEGEDHAVWIVDRRELRFNVSVAGERRDGGFDTLSVGVGDCEQDISSWTPLIGGFAMLGATLAGEDEIEVGETQTFCFRTRDRAGNISDPLSVDVQLDDRRPLFDVALEPPATSREPQVVRAGSDMGIVVTESTVSSLTASFMTGDSAPIETCSGLEFGLDEEPDSTPPVYAGDFPWHEFEDCELDSSGRYLVALTGSNQFGDSVTRTLGFTVDAEAPQATLRHIVTASGVDALFEFGARRWVEAEDGGLRAWLTNDPDVVEAPLDADVAHIVQCGGDGLCVNRANRAVMCGEQEIGFGVRGGVDYRLSAASGQACLRMTPSDAAGPGEPVELYLHRGPAPLHTLGIVVDTFTAAAGDDSARVLSPDDDQTYTFAAGPDRLRLRLPDGLDLSTITDWAVVITLRERRDAEGEQPAIDPWQETDEAAIGDDRPPALIISWPPAEPDDDGGETPLEPDPDATYRVAVFALDGDRDGEDAVQVGAARLKFVPAAEPEPPGFPFFDP